MNYGTKEFHDLRNQFEKDIQKMPVRFGKVEREVRGEKTPNTVWYTDQIVNAMFIAYMVGYGNGRLNYMQ